jgi:hypothetical protein
MMRASVRRGVIAYLMLLTPPLAPPGYSQETTGTILGTLVDQTGAVLPGVKVAITSVETAQSREVVTNHAGQYAESLPVGNYEISFQLPKFQPFTARGISLHVNDRLQVNAKLVLGAIETLTVTAERLVQPTSSVQYLIQPTAIRELPLRTRTPVQLVTLVPGVSSDLREDACFCDQGNLNISINGARRSAVNWLLDGANNVNSWDSYTAVTTPSLEAIQEINVITSSYSAEWARNGGGVVNAVTRSGTSRFSGSAYHFLRNDALNANSFFRNMNSRPDVADRPPRLRYNDFGYTLGGPALPSRKKLFFFLSQEWRRSSRDKRTIEAFVPDPTWLTNPASPNYVAPEARDPNAVKLLTLWPAPNVPGTNRYRTTITNELDTGQEFVRADYNVGTKWSLTGRYLHDRTDSLGEYVTGPDIAPGRRDRVGDLAIVEARRAGTRWLHELSYQVSSHEQVRHGGAHTRESLGIQIPEVFPENAANLVPRLSVIGVASFEGSEFISREHLSHTFSSALTLQHSTHRLKAGGLIVFERADSNLFDELTQGWFIFLPGGGFTAFQNFLRGNGDGACGQSCRYLERDIDVLNRLRSGRYEVFIQDTWRIHPRVTLDLGLRYAFYPPVTDRSNRLFAYSPDAYDPAQAPAFADSTGNLLAVGTGNLFNGIRIAGRNSPHGRALYAADWNNLQPRFGASWDPGGAGRFIVRAGYGMYFDQTRLERFAYSTQEPRNNPLRTEVSVNNPRLSNPAGGSVVQASTVAAAYVLGISDPFVAPRWQQWNVGVQRRLYSHAVIDIGYVGSAGDQLPRYVDINQPQPANLVGHGEAPNTVRPFLGYSSIFMQETTARSRYQGVVASFRHEAGRAGTVTASYTLSRNKADATYDFGYVDDPQNPLDKAVEYAAAVTDRTQIFSASYIYELPFAGDGAGRWRKAFLGGWQIAGATWIESGPPARMEVVNFNYEGGFFPSALRPNQVGDPAAGEAGVHWFNPAAFVPSPAGEYGHAPVTPFRLPGRHQWDVAISKTMNLIRTTRLQLRADFINAFNHTQFLDVNTSCVGTTSCDTEFGFGQARNTRPPREIQLGVRVDW